MGPTHFSHSQATPTVCLKLVGDTVAMSLKSRGDSYSVFSFQCPLSEATLSDPGPVPRPDLTQNDRMHRYPLRLVLGSGKRNA